MKNRVLLTLILLIAEGCLATDTTTPQVSYSIAESKKGGFFVREYYLKKSPFEDFIVEEAWIEKGSFNNKKGVLIVREAENWCQLCFKLKQVPSSKFLIKDVLNWSMRDVERNEGVGIKGRARSGKPPVGVYIYNLDDAKECITPDSISFNLITGSKRNNNQIHVGKFTLYATDNR